MRPYNDLNNNPYNNNQNKRSHNDLNNNSYNNKNQNNRSHNNENSSSDRNNRPYNNNKINRDNYENNLNNGPYNNNYPNNNDNKNNGPAYEIIEKNNIITNDHYLNEKNKNPYKIIPKNNTITKDNYLKNKNNQNNGPAYEIIEKTNEITNDHYLNEKNKNPYKIIRKNNTITKDNYLFKEDNRNGPAYEIIENTNVITNDHYLNEKNNRNKFSKEIPKNLRNRDSYFDGRLINSDLNDDFRETQKKMFLENIKLNKKMDLVERINKEKKLESVLNRFFKKIVVYNSKIEQLKRKIISENIIIEIFSLYKIGNYWNYNSLNLYLKNLGLNFLPSQKKRLFLSICDLDKENKKIITYKNLLQFFNPSLIRNSKTRQFDTFSNNLDKNENDRFSELLNKKKTSLKIKGSSFHLFRRLIIYNLKKIEDLTLIVQFLNQNKLSTLFLSVSKMDNFINHKNLFRFINKNKGKILKDDFGLIFKEFEFGNQINISFKNFESFFNKKIWKIPI